MEIWEDIFDAEYAEFMEHHPDEKMHVRNRRRADRKHKLTPKMRKEQELMRKDRMYGYCWNLDCPKVRFAPDSEPIKNRKYAEYDRIDRDDWETEKENHADAMAEYYRMADMADGLERMLEKSFDEFKSGNDSELESGRMWEYRDAYRAYTGEADKIYDGEAYFRRQKSFGVNARIYLGLAYRDRK